MKMREQIISHLYKNEDNGEWVIQTNKEHLSGVAEMASSFAGKFGMSYWGYILGILHDKGKERNSFQQYIRITNGLSFEGMKTSEDHNHAFVGGLIANHIMGRSVDNLLSNQIISHHTGLHNWMDIETILKERKIPSEIDTTDVDIDKSLLIKELRNSHIGRLDSDLNNFNHLSRVLFSCLTDADWLDTEKFMDRNSWEKRKCSSTLSDLLPKLESFIDKLQASAVESEVNNIRKMVLEQCKLMSKSEKGFYSLTVPTGGGKTLSSLLWAMRHTVCNNMERIIIAIPYTSIIVQTAGLLKGIFGEENVLEHHSNFNPDEIKDEEKRDKAKLATENWDYPIIVTTNVQLFESMFSNKPSDCRKLHNIVNSVIILDEVQTLPTDFLQPIVDAMKAYQNMFGISILFTTASQPVLSGLITGSNPTGEFEGIKKITEIIPEKFALHDKLRRVKLDIDNEGCTYDEISSRIAEYDKVLCIVNTRKDAKEIYERLPNDGIKLHLSRMMCPRHISQTIIRIKSLLKDETVPIIRVVATQLIEAGVDIDFPVVFRQEAGLDSVLQAAGRCNREGRIQMGQTFVFSLCKENRNPYGSMAAANNARKNLPTNSDWFSPETMKDYFLQLYSRKNTFDIKDIKHYLYNPNNPNELCFEKASSKFKLIEDKGVNVIVNWEDSMELVQQLKDYGCTYSLMKQLAQYTVGIHKSDFNTLIGFGVLEKVLEGIYVLYDRSQYNPTTGLSLNNHWMEEILMI